MVKITKAEARLLRFAIEITIGSEEELIDCHTHYGKVHKADRSVVRKSQAIIRRLRKLWKKLHPATAPTS